MSEPVYQPSKKEDDRINYVYQEVRNMLNVFHTRYKYFNDRTLKEFIDDSEYRITGYVPTREEQGKEDWQANVMQPKTRNKFKATLASVAQDIPDTKIVAQNDKQLRDQRRAYVMRHLVKGSYGSDEKELINYREAWECGVKGTIITYEGYARQKAKKKIFKSFNTETGEHEFEEKEIVIKDECISFIIPLENFLISDVSIPDVQDQPAVAWIQNMNKGKFDQEFSKYKNHKYVKSAGDTATTEETKREFADDWIDRTNQTKDRPIEVIRYYNKFEDEFITIANGVVLLDAPMILGKKEKKYPFAKTIFDIFAVDFFYGNSFANAFMSNQDIGDALTNMMLDKTYMSMNTPLIIGNKNKDDFDLEDTSVGIDTRIYVEEINDIKELPISGIDNGMIQMSQMNDSQIDESSVDSNQQGIQSGGATAREVVIANENARKLKGVIFMFLTSLWTQKYKLRIENILTYYTQPKIKTLLSSTGKENKLDEYRKFMIEGADMSEPGQKGTLAIQMVGNESQLPDKEDPKELDELEEKQEKMNDENFEILMISSDYLQNWEYDVKVISDSLHQKESSLTRANQEDKIQMLQAFPDLFMLNQEKIFKDTITAMGDDPDEYETSPPPPPMPEEGMLEEGGEPGAELATAGQAGLPDIPK